LLRVLDAIGGPVLEAAFFVAAAWNICFHKSFSEALLPGALVLVFAAVFWLSRHSVIFESYYTIFENNQPDHRIEPSKK
jgi:hypothetical protein